MNYTDRYISLYQKYQETEEKSQNLVKELSTLSDNLDNLYPKTIQEKLPEIVGKLFLIEDMKNNIRNYFYITETQEVYCLEYDEVDPLGNLSEIDFNKSLSDLGRNRIFKSISCLFKKDFNKMFNLNSDWETKEIPVEALLTEECEAFREFGKILLEDRIEDLTIFYTVHVASDDCFHTCCGETLEYLEPWNKVEKITELLELLRDYPQKVCSYCKRDIQRRLNKDS